MSSWLRNLFGKAASPDARDLFAAEVDAFLRSLPGVEDVKRASDAFAFDLRVAGGTRRIFLDNAFAETREMSPEDRRRRIAFFFASIGDDAKDEPWEVARGQLVPVIRATTFGLELRASHPEAAFVRRPFVPYIDQLVALDRPTSMSFVGRSKLDTWGVKDEDVLAAAEARAFPLLEGASVDRYDDTHGPLWIVASNDTYESSRLLVPGWLASFRGKVEGNPLAIVPERSTVMIGGDGRVEMIERLLDKAAREFDSSSRRVSPSLYTVDGDDRVVPYVRPSRDALAWKVKTSHLKLAHHEYGYQKEVLGKLFEKVGLDVFVATYQVFEKPDGELRSLSVWTKGARSYLPRTESVVLNILDESSRKATTTVEVPFEAVEPRLTLVPDLHPARYETGEFPGDAELGALAGRS